MRIWQRLRGLLGTAITWGTVGATVGALMFAMRYRPWPIAAIHWGRFLTLFGLFVAAGALWGSASGLAFGLTVWHAERRRHFGQLSTRRIMVWGAVAGAAFPVLLYTPSVLRGTFDIPLFSILVGLSTLAGVACARATFAIAKRAPDRAEDLAELAASSPALDSIEPLAARESVS
jgi:hypothetical protein